MKFQDKVCVVTGGANGIGRCIVQAFCNAGARMAVIDRDAVAGQALVDRYGGEQLLFYPGDVAEKKALEAFARLLVRRFGGVDCLVHNACCGMGGLLSGCSYEDFLYVQRVGVAAPYYLTGLLRDCFVPGASVVNIASTRAVQSQPDTESYSAAKGGIVSLTHAMSASLAGKARVNAVSPGWIDTAGYRTEAAPPSQQTEADRLQHPAGRVGTPEDIAGVVLFLCSEAAGFLTGETITVDGGMSRLMIYHNDRGWSYTPKEEEGR